MLAEVAYLIGGLFGAGLLLLLALAAAGRATRSLWVAYGMELPIVLAVLVPAYVGGPSLAIALFALTLTAGRELRRVLALAGASRPLAAAGYLYLALGAVGLALLAARTNGF